MDKQITEKNKLLNIQTHVQTENQTGSKETDRYNKQTLHRLTGEINKIGQTDN